MREEKLSEDEIEFLQDALTAKPVGGKSVWITGGAVYEIDNNFDPPKVKKMKEEE